MIHSLVRHGATLSTMSACLVAAGCGGGDGTATGASSATNVPTKGVFSGYDASLDNVGADGGGGAGDGGFGIGGSLGRIRGATVIATLADGSLLGQAPVDENGRATIRPGSDYTGPVLVRIVGTAGGAYFDEAVQADLPFGANDSLALVVPSPPAGLVAVTPFTDAAYRTVQATAQGQDPLADAGLIASANDRVRDEINRFLPDALQLAGTVAPVTLVDATTPAGSLGESVADRHARILAAIAEAAQAFDPGLARPAAAFAQSLANDLGDGRLDGTDVDGQPVSGPAGLGYDPARLRDDLAAGVAAADERYADHGSSGSGGSGGSGGGTGGDLTDAPGNAAPSLAVCPSTWDFGGQFEPLPLDSITPAGTSTDSFVCRYRSETGGTVNGFSISASPYSNAELERCGQPGEDVAVQTNVGTVVAYSTRRQVRVFNNAPDDYDTTRGILLRAVSEGVGERCP